MYFSVLYVIYKSIAFVSNNEPPWWKYSFCVIKLLYLVRFLEKMCSMYIR